MNNYLTNQQTLEQSEAPIKCQDCGVQRQLAADLGRMIIDKAALEEVGRALMTEGFDKFVADRVPEVCTETVKRDTRKGFGRAIEDLDDEIAEGRAEIKANAEVCSGIFKMNGICQGVIYSADICTSKRVYEEHGEAGQLESELLTHIQVSSA